MFLTPSPRPPASERDSWRLRSLLLEGDIGVQRGGRQQHGLHGRVLPAKGARPAPRAGGALSPPPWTGPFQGHAQGHPLVTTSPSTTAGPPARPPAAQSELPAPTDHLPALSPRQADFLPPAARGSDRRVPPRAVLGTRRAPAPLFPRPSLAAAACWGTRRRPARGQERARAPRVPPCLARASPEDAPPPHSPGRPGRGRRVAPSAPPRPGKRRGPGRRPRAGAQEAALGAPIGQLRRDAGTGCAHWSSRDASRAASGSRRVRAAASGAARSARCWERGRTHRPPAPPGPARAPQHRPAPPALLVAPRTRPPEPAGKERGRGGRVPGCATPR